MPDVHRATWVLPISAPPIRDGWVAIDDDRVVGVGGPDTLPEPDAQPTLRAPLVAILPGLVNAHTHLELSWMRGSVPPGGAMPDWAARLIALRRTRGDDPPAPIADAIAESRATGTALVGDVTNTLAAYRPLAESSLSAAVFLELIGFRSGDPDGIVDDARRRLESLTPIDRLRPALAPHAPYSVSPELFRALGNAARGRPFSVHLGESVEEIGFLRDGAGPWRELLERLGAWTPEWVPPSCSPVEYLDRLGLLNERLVAVHATHLTDPDLKRLKAAGATVVTCPRSNRWTGSGVPPVERFYASGVRVAIGTDSLASVEDLNMFNEMAAVRRLAPAVAARQILLSATLDGARALGFEREHGSIEPGKRGELVAVRIPPGIQDVEEYLVGEVQPKDITWLSTSSKP
jgi:cytosine/adenosine deaminase-related metal-dependent hydrolase